jgi:hypothetical protein
MKLGLSEGMVLAAGSGGHPVQCRDMLPAELIRKASEQVGNRVANPAAFWFDIRKSSVITFTLHPSMP